ncbi:hypothetical protein Pen01_18090 [Phytomonospora endophytica]|nr:hypothetical protein Pen01_18090 [Phytomonospora endophytica]
MPAATAAVVKSLRMMRFPPLFFRRHRRAECPDPMVRPKAGMNARERAWKASLVGSDRVLGGPLGRGRVRPRGE